MYTSFHGNIIVKIIVIVKTIVKTIVITIVKIDNDCENTLLYKTWKVIKSILDTMGLEPTTSTNTSTVGKAHTITTKLS